MGRGPLSCFHAKLGWLSPGLGSPGNRAAFRWHVGIPLCPGGEQASSLEMGVGVRRGCPGQHPGLLGSWEGQPFLASVSPCVKWEWVGRSRLRSCSAFSTVCRAVGRTWAGSPDLSPLLQGPTSWSPTVLLSTATLPCPARWLLSLTPSWPAGCGECTWVSGGRVSRSSS